jgi:hypothetical protein
VYRLYTLDNKMNKYISQPSPPSPPHVDKFVNAYDELNDNRRKLFDIPHIDNFFYFQGEKNISIINRCKTTHLLYHLVTKLCIEYAKNNEKSKTILIDGGGNNLGRIYLDLIKLPVKEQQQQFDINLLLNNIIISRVFTLYQLANTVINKLPTLISKLNCKTQIIVLDIFNTLFSSASADTVNSESVKNAIDIEEDKIKLLDEILQNITNFSKHHFSILAFTDFRKIFNKNIFSHFNQILEISSIDNNKSNKNQSILHMRRMSDEKSLMLNSTIEIDR